MKAIICKYCNHTMNDHKIVKVLEKGKVVKTYRGKCQWIDCICEILEYPNEMIEGYSVVKKIEEKRDPYYEWNGVNHTCKNCGRKFKKKISLSAHKGHCKDVLRRKQEMKE